MRDINSTSKIPEENEELKIKEQEREKVALFAIQKTVLYALFFYFGPALLSDCSPVCAASEVINETLSSPEGASPSSSTNSHSSSGSNNLGSEPTTPTPSLTTSPKLTDTSILAKASGSKTTTPVTLEDKSYFTPEPKTATNTEVQPNKSPVGEQDLEWSPEPPQNPAVLQGLSNFWSSFYPKPAK